MAPLGTVYAGNPPTSTCIWMLSHTTIQPISISCSRPWYTEIEPSVTRKVSQGSQNSCTVHSHRTATLTSRSTVLSSHLARRTHLEKNQHWWLSYSLWDLSSSKSKGCKWDMT